MMESKSIGRIALPGGNFATLSDRGEWQCDDGDVLGILRMSYNPRNMIGVANVMPFGVQAVTQGAVAVGGKAELFVKMPPPEEDVLY